MKEKILAVIMVMAISLNSLSVFAIVDDYEYMPEENSIYQEMVAARGPGPGNGPPPDEYPD